MYFQIKNILKNNRNHTPKQVSNCVQRNLSKLVMEAILMQSPILSITWIKNLRDIT
jgi:hypothetical protein